MAHQNRTTKFKWWSQNQNFEIEVPTKEINNFNRSATDQRIHPILKKYLYNIVCVKNPKNKEETRIIYWQTLRNLYNG